MEKIAIVCSLFALLLLAGCAMSVAELESEKAEYVDKEVAVKGIVTATVKLGPISGYTLKDETSDATIKVSSETLPKEGDTITVKGLWKKDTLLGYYLKAE